MEQPGFKEMQDIIKAVAKKSMLDEEYRRLCLKDSRAALQKVNGKSAKIPDNIIFLEEEPPIMAEDRFIYILPPFLKPSWLTSK